MENSMSRFMFLVIMVSLFISLYLFCDLQNKFRMVVVCVGLYGIYICILYISLFLRTFYFLNICVCVRVSVCVCARTRFQSRNIHWVAGMCFPALTLYNSFFAQLRIPIKGSKCWKPLFVCILLSNLRGLWLKDINLLTCLLAFMGQV